MSYLNPHTHNLDGPDADGSIRTIGAVAPPVASAAIRAALDTWIGPDRPRIVCLCGSTRFGEAFRDANLRETLAGRIVLSIGCDTKSDGDLFDVAPGEVARIKADLDVLHKHKITLADEVLVLNVGGYIGESTCSEITHAELLGKPIRYLEPIGVSE